MTMHSDMPAARFVTTASGPSWLLFTDPEFGHRLNPVIPPEWNTWLHKLESRVADETALGFEDLETRIAAELADQQALFDLIDLPPLPLAASPAPARPVTGRLRRRLRGISPRRR